MVAKQDDDIIRSVLSGNTNDFAELIDRYQQNMYHFFLSLLHHPADAEDATSESLIKAYKALASFRLGSSFKSWVMSITYHTALDILRQRKRYSDFPIEDKLSTQASEDNPLGSILKDERQVILFQALGQLSSDERAAIYLYYYQDASYKDIARTLDWPMGTVASKLNRCRQKLKKYLKDGDLLVE